MGTVMHADRQINVIKKIRRLKNAHTTEFHSLDLYAKKR